MNKLVMLRISVILEATTSIFQDKRIVVTQMAKHNSKKFSSIRLSKLSNKCKNEPSLEKYDHKYVSI